ncbi:MAG: hypothetical protein K1X53_14420 [Candidatus Sumerlaeaceae bacterium]|nr:hypothetical protein [Candidatus Sumerlaeaceae bacterium]
MIFKNRSIFYSLVAAVGTLLFPLTAHTATIAGWSNANLNVNAAVLADGPNTGTLSRGSITYANTANAYNSSNWALATEESAPSFNGKYLSIEVSTVGFTGIKISYTDQRSSTGPPNSKIYYSTTGSGGTFTLAPSGNFTVATTGTNRTVDLSSIPALDNNANVVFRIHSWGASASGGTFRVSSLAVTDAAGVTPPVSNTGPISSVKAAADGSQWILTSGTVTSVGGNTNRRGFTIQDATGGILIDNNASLTYTVPAVGDFVNITTGTKTTFSGAIELQPTSNAAVVIVNSGNPLPTPQTFLTVDSFLASSTATVQSNYIRINNVFLGGSVPTGGGTTTWLDATTTGGVNYLLTSNGVTSVSLRLTADLGGTEATWQAKARPAVANSTDRFDLFAVSTVFAGALQISLNSPVGTTAKTDSTGPIRAATIPASAKDWERYD